MCLTLSVCDQFHKYVIGAASYHNRTINHPSVLLPIINTIIIYSWIAETLIKEGFWKKRGKFWFRNLRKWLGGNLILFFYGGWSYQYPECVINTFKDLQEAFLLRRT